MHAIVITLKDLRLLMRDRRALIVLLALPLVLISVIGISGKELVSRRDQNTTPTEVSPSKLTQGSEDPSRVYRAIVPGFTVLFVFFW